MKNYRFKRERTLFQRESSISKNSHKPSEIKKNQTLQSAAKVEIKCLGRNAKSIRETLDLIIKTLQ